MVNSVPETIDFPKSEELIIKYWQEIKAFETSLKQSNGKPSFVFFDGPPFATGLPHYGHILAGKLFHPIISTLYSHT